LVHKKFYGKKLTEDHKKKLSMARTGKVPWNKGMKLPSSWNKGITGEKSHFWKGMDSHSKSYRNFMCRRRQVMKKGNGGSHTLEEWKELKRFYNSMCLCCKKQEPFIKLTEDHIIPVSIGGSDNISNIQPLCGSCNSIKHDKILNYKLSVNQMVCL
jgi:5-methylcytosine-specific restriction endonuclease McrA